MSRGLIRGRTDTPRDTERGCSGFGGSATTPALAKVTSYIRGRTESLEHSRGGCYAQFHQGGRTAGDGDAIGGAATGGKGGPDEGGEGHGTIARGMADAIRSDRQ